MTIFDILMCSQYNLISRYFRLLINIILSAIYSSINVCDQAILRHCIFKSLNIFKNLVIYIRKHNFKA